MKKCLLASLVLAGLMVSDVTAQGGRGGIAETLKRLDKNNDGKLSKDELKAMPEQFLGRFMERADTNKDGEIDAKEMKKLAEGGFGGRGFGRGQGGRGGRGGFDRGSLMKRMMQAFPIIKAIDADGDGEISEKEMKNAYKALKALDKNKDGKLSGSEIQPAFGGFGGGRTRPGGRPGSGRPGSGRPRRPGGDDKDID